MGLGQTLLVLLGLTMWGLLGGQAEAAGPLMEFLGPPATRLKWGEDGQTPQILLAGAKNEYLAWPVVIEGNPSRLRVSLQTPRDSLEWRIFQALPVPLAAAGKLPPDVLVPYEEGWEEAAAAPLLLWISLRIPPDFPPGRHPLRLILAAENRLLSLPAELWVYRFTLPHDLPLTLFAGFWPQYGPWNRRNKNLGPQDLELIKSYYRRLREYKFNALGGSWPLPPAVLQSGAELEAVSPFHELVSYALKDLGFRYIQIPRIQGWERASDPNSPFSRQAQVLYPLLAAYLRRHGWEGRAINYLVDEPSPARLPAVLEAYRAAKQLAPGIRTLCAGWGEPSRFTGAIDIWAHQAAHFRPEEARRAQISGQESWLYINRLHTLGPPLSHPRLIGWLLFHHGFSGYLLWGVNFWPQDPWHTFPGPHDFFRRGTFFYPHPKTGTPLPSLRLEALRRGFQDYQYLALLKEAGMKGQVPQRSCQKIFLKVASLAENLPANPFPVSMAELEDLRLQMGRLLDEGYGRENSGEP